MDIIGINWEQNSTASLWRDGEFIACVSEERFTRKKNDESYPLNAITWILNEFKVEKENIEAVVFVSTMWSYGYTLTRHYTNFSVKDYIDEQHNIWKPRIYDGKNISQVNYYKDRLDLEQYPGEEFWNEVLDRYKEDSGHVSSESSKEIAKIRKDVVIRHLGIKEEKIVFMDHSSSHAAYGYYTSNEHLQGRDALVVTLDAFGDNVNYSALIFRGDGTKEEIVKGASFIIGRLYRYITLILGLRPNEHEYKVMGMAPYCKDKYSENVFNLFKSYQDVDGIEFKYKSKPKDMYFEVRNMLEGERFDSICGGVQRYTEYLLTKWIKNLTELTGVKRLIVTGGVGMNVKANMVLAKEGGLENIYIPPSPDDSSQAMGAVLEYLRQKKYQGEILKGLNVYSGPKANTPEVLKNKYIEKEINGIKQRYIVQKKFNNSEIAELLAKGMVIARCHGKQEFGARALGNRSIMADPRRNEVKQIINEKIKSRDFWMPFACSVISEKADEYFLMDAEMSSYEYMTLCCMTTDKGKRDLQAAIHPYDNTCRPQIVYKHKNREYHELIEAFGELTGVYGILNTSFNLHGLPIVNNADDAVHVLENSEIDGILFEDRLVIREN
tara:strand:+ start:1061 stop:2890 length:1830 start_codon:yes stop_codon:yes gene_type:complete